jgi:hypothetical protein
VSLVRPNLEYKSYLYRPFYDVHIHRIAGVQKKYEGWDERTCTIYPRKRSNASIIFVFDILSRRVSSANFVNVIAPRYHTWGVDFLYTIWFSWHYLQHSQMNGVVGHFNEVTGLSNFHLSRNQFFDCLCCDLVQFFTFCWIILYTVLWPLLYGLIFFRCIDLLTLQVSYSRIL